MNTSNEFNPDWDQVEALQEALREHMAEIQRLRQALTPPKHEWVGLTDDEIDTWNIVGHESLREFVRDIEAKLKEKNT